MCEPVNVVITENQAQQKFIEYALIGDFIKYEKMNIIMNNLILLKAQRKTENAQKLFLITHSIIICNLH